MTHALQLRGVFDTEPIEGACTMPTSNPPNTFPLVLRLDPDQCWTRLQQSRTGRVVVLRNGVVEIRPVNYAANERTITFTTASSTLIDAAAAECPFVFEADGHDGWTAWSVIVRGSSAITTPQTLHANRPVRSMVATVRTRYITMTPTNVTGRLFDQAD